MRTPLMDFSDLVAECRMYIRDGRKWGGMENSITDRDVDGIIAADAYLVALRARCEDVEGILQAMKEEDELRSLGWDVRMEHLARAVSKFLVEGKG